MLIYLLFAGYFAATDIPGFNPDFSEAFPELIFDMGDEIVIPEELFLELSMTNASGTGLIEPDLAVESWMTTPFMLESKGVRVQDQPPKNSDLQTE